jgi:hypothetical protein
MFQLLLSHLQAIYNVSRHNTGGTATVQADWWSSNDFVSDKYPLFSSESFHSKKRITKFLVQFEATSSNTFMHASVSWSPWLIDLQWVWTLMVLMHLGLIDRSFAPHNLISAHESPVPLSKIQMASRLNILMSSGSKKRRHTFIFSQNVPDKRIPSSSQWGPL